MNQKNHFAKTAGSLGLLVGAAWLGGCQSQSTFSKPEDAVTKLASAVEQKDRGEMRELFGSRVSELRSDDPDLDRTDLDVFARRLKEQHQIEMQSDDRAVVLLGQDRWPFAVPIVKEKDAWRFDTDAGIEELNNRRIGRNELQVIGACRTLIDAQREYISMDRNGDGVPEYAQRLMSTEGTHDGLYWPAPGGVDPSPIGPVLAQAATRTDDQGHRIPYYGYLFKALYKSGPGASGGARDYKVNGRLTNGWAVIARPAEYDVSGVMSFLLGSDGTVYEKDLGPDTEAIVQKMDAYDPSNGWKPAP